MIERTFNFKSLTNSACNKFYYIKSFEFYCSVIVILQRKSIMESIVETLPYKCKWYKSAACPMRFATVQDAVKHQEETHMKGVSYPCSYCGEVFKRKRFLTAHVCSQLQLQEDSDSSEEEPITFEKSSSKQSSSKNTSKSILKSKIKTKDKTKRNINTKIKAKKHNELVL